MSLVLLDTSVWIEYFSPRTKISEQSLAQLRQFIMDDEVVMIEPIRAELLSGKIRSSQYSNLERLLTTVTLIDLDWNARKTWDSVVNLASHASSSRNPVPGLIDRMILLSAQEASVAICTLDKAILKLAETLKIDIFPICRSK